MSISGASSGRTGSLPISRSRRSRWSRIRGKNSIHRSDHGRARLLNFTDTVSAIISIGFHGLAFAMVLYLISVGLSVTMGLMGFVNLAHGVFAMAGGYVLTSLMSRGGVPFVPALLAAAVAVSLVSIPIERVLYRRLYGGEELDQVLLTMGLVFMSVAGATYI